MITIIGVRRRFQWHKISDIFFALLAFSYLACWLINCNFYGQQSFL